MSIGTFTLFAALFFSDMQESILLENLEEGVKHHITETSRSKEILNEIKAIEKSFNDFNKSKIAGATNLRFYRNILLLFAIGDNLHHKNRIIE